MNTQPFAGARHTARARLMSGLILATVGMLAGGVWMGASHLRKDRNAAATGQLSEIQHADTSVIAVGKTAPQITWKDARSGKTMHLSDFRGKPVVLFFGSSTCPPFRLNTPKIDELRRSYEGRINCFMIYSAEAHPDYSSKAYMQEAKTLEDRKHAAQDLVTDTNLSTNILLDTMDNQAGKMCGTFPSRIFVLDAKGKIAYFSGQPSSMMMFPIKGILDRLLAVDKGSRS